LAAKSVPLVQQVLPELRAPPVLLVTLDQLESPVQQDQPVQREPLVQQVELMAAQVSLITW
jgi:hypothetical protein